MSSQPERIRQFEEQLEIARQLYASLDTCPEEQRPEIRKKILEMDVALWELLHKPSEPAD